VNGASSPQRESGPNPTAPPVALREIASPVGPLLAGASDDGLCLLEFADTDRPEQAIVWLARVNGRPARAAAHPLLDRLEDELERYFRGELRTFTLPLDAPGTPFQERVWNELLRIPYGETLSYEALARRLGDPKALRAVGAANGRNRIAIVIPCHRVINADGGLGGYGGGLSRKKLLLDLERGTPTLFER
jgi:AraC family transcriptional regulator of adaptative response/methylated-DNA-[protein]-cysteine methyltransferase